MFIQTESTPNPATLKFLPGRPVMSEGTADFRDAEAGRNSPLARRLFAINGVSGVFFGSDFVTVTKAKGEWPQLKPLILEAIMEHAQRGEALFEGKAPADEKADASADGPDATIIADIKELLDTRVRPAVAQDGGDITFHSYEEGVVYLHMKGSCSGCPSSTATLKQGIENMLRHYLPEVREVRPI